MEQHSLAEPNTMDHVNPVGPSIWVGVTAVIKMVVTRVETLLVRPMGLANSQAKGVLPVMSCSVTYQDDPLPE